MTLALRHAASQASQGVPANLAAVHGYAVSFRIGAALLTIGGLLVLLTLERVNTQLRNPLAERSGHGTGSGRPGSSVSRGPVAAPRPPA